jgi:hypothetical protein
MSTQTKTEAKKIDRDFVMTVASHVMAARIVSVRDLTAVDDAHFDQLADVSVRAALALDAAIPRAEERLAAEAKAADDAKAAQEAAEKATQDAAKDAADQVATDQKAAVHPVKASAKK